MPEPCIPGNPQAATFSQSFEWTYRYSPDGFREQRRLMRSPKHDSTNCTGIMPWMYYINDVGGEVLAVYHGRQTKRPLPGCTLPPTERRVFMYPMEFRSYGPDGVNVVYERDGQGAMVKRFYVLDYQGSVAAVIGNQCEDYMSYSVFGERLGAWPHRTGYLDRETDEETSPWCDSLKLLDLVARKYVPALGTFNTPDPLWMLTPEASSYHYAMHDPVNITDPWGLDGDGIAGHPPSKLGPMIDGGPKGAVGADWWFSSYFDVVTLLADMRLRAAARAWESDAMSFLNSLSYSTPSLSFGGSGGGGGGGWALYIPPYKDPFMVRPIRAVVVEVEREYRDLTIEFTNHVKKIEKMFDGSGNLIHDLFHGLFQPFGYAVKIATFGYIQYKGANTSLLNPKKFEDSRFYDGGIFHGRYFTGADFGNYAYGVAARSMGIDPYTAIQGAGAYALYSGSATTWWNVAGCYDDAIDTDMILRGYFGR